MSCRTAVGSLVASMIMAGGAAAGNASEVLKSLSDKARERVYVLVHDGVKVLEPGTRRELAHVALPGWVWAGDAYSCPPDIALAPAGDVLVTSNVMPAIWRIERRTFAVTMHELALEHDTDKDIGFTGLRWSPHLDTFVAITDLGAKWHVDRSVSKARKVSGAPVGRTPDLCGE